MQFTAVIATLFAAAGAVALPADVVERQAPYVPCSGLSGSPVCCATDVLGLVNLDCGNPPSTPTDGANFSAICAAMGQRARCCALPVLEQGLLCAVPSGVQD